MNLNIESHPVLVSIIIAVITIIATRIGYWLNKKKKISNTNYIKAGGDIIAGRDIIVKDIKSDMRRAGIINEGSHNSFIDCEAIGPDAGIIDKGNNTKVIRGEYKSIRKK
jgi:hypothetical protein